MPKTGEKFTTTLLQAHLEWGEYRHTDSRGVVYGEGYLQIPADHAYAFEITNDKDTTRSQIYDFNTSDGFITKGTLKASGNQNRINYAKQFHGNGDLKLLGDWFAHIGAKVGDQIEIKFTSPSEVLLTKI